MLMEMSLRIIESERNFEPKEVNSSLVKIFIFELDSNQYCLSKIKMDDQDGGQLFVIRHIQS